MAKAKNGAAKRQPARKVRSMPKFTRAPGELIETFTRAVADLPGVQTRKMFGYPAAFTKGQMFASVFQSELILRLPEAERQTLGQDGGRAFEPMPGRPSREYMVVPGAIRASAPSLRAWVVKAKTYVDGLPPKKKK
jgi:TfoX/Sxy family transcriptional regulator of competence genes